MMLLTITSGSISTIYILRNLSAYLVLLLFYIQPVQAQKLQHYNFCNPKDVFIDDYGNILVLLSSEVAYFDSTGRFIKKIRLANPASFRFPFNPVSLIAYKESIYVSDPYNHGIVEYALSGEITRVITLDHKSTPRGMTLSSEGDIYFSDSSKGSISVLKAEQISSKSTEISKGDVFSGLAYPTDVAIGKNGQFYIADASGGVKIFDGNGRYIKTLGSAFFNSVSVSESGKVAAVDMINHRVEIFDRHKDSILQVGEPGSSLNEFCYPISVQINARGLLFIADNGNDRVKVLDGKGDFLFQLGVTSNTPGIFRDPSGLVIGQDGNLIVADSDNHRIQITDKAGNFINMFGSKGSSEGQFNRPRDVIVSKDGRLFVLDSDNHRIQIFDQQYRYLGSFGSKGKEVGQLLFPQGFAIDGIENLYIADTRNNRIQIFDSTGRAKVLAKELDSPLSIVVTSSGVFTLDQKGRVIKIDSEGDHQHLPGSVAQGIAADSVGNLYIVSEKEVRVVGNNGERVAAITTADLQIASSLSPARFVVNNNFLIISDDCCVREIPFSLASDNSNSITSSVHVASFNPYYVNVFPNPSSEGRFIIETNFPDVPHFVLKNNRGELVPVNIIQELPGVYSVSVNNLNSGIYFLRVSYASASITRKIIKETDIHQVDAVPNK